MSPAPIMVTTDFSDLASAAFEYAGSAARAASSQLYIVSVALDANTEKALDSQSPHHKEYQDYHTAIMNCVLQRLEALTAIHFHGQPVQPIVLRSRHSVAAALADFARENQCSLVVMAKHGAGRLEGTACGTTVERMMQISQVPVMVVPTPAC